MKSIKTVEELIAQIASRPERKRMAVVWGQDESTRGAVSEALDKNLVDAIFVGCNKEVESDTNLQRSIDHISIVEAQTADDAAATAVALVRRGEADMIMKGMINTDNFLRAVLNRETGILKPGNVLTHIAITELPGSERLLLFTDAAAIPYPDPAQRRCQLRYLEGIFKKLGVAHPKIALIHCSEKVDGRHFPFTEDYEQLRRLSNVGESGDCIVDGPLDLKTSLSPSALAKKGIESPIQGMADGLVFPDIVSANTFYKTVSLLSDAPIGGIICGGSAPVVLASRGDSPESKFLSIAIASL